MEQKNKTTFGRLRLSMWIISILIVITSLGDIVTTLLSKYKHHSIFNELEVQPLFILGIPLWVLMAIKLLVMFYLIYIFIVRYHLNNIYINFFYVNMLILLIVLCGALTINNYKAYQLPTESIIPPSKEQRDAGYNKMVYDMEVVKNLQPTTFKIPAIIYILGWNLLIFVIWADFEKCKT